jgi:hypothetical protein
VDALIDLAWRGGGIEKNLEIEKQSRDSRPHLLFKSTGQSFLSYLAAHSFEGDLQDISFIALSPEAAFEVLRQDTERVKLFQGKLRRMCFRVLFSDRCCPCGIV